MAAVIKLGGPRATRRESQDLRRGAITVHSPFGLDVCAALLIEAIPKDPRPSAPGRPVRALFGMDTEGAPALAATVLWPSADVRWFHFDSYVAAKVAEVFEDNWRTEAPGAEGARGPGSPGPADAAESPDAQDAQDAPPASNASPGAAEADTSERHAARPRGMAGPHPGAVAAAAADLPGPPDVAPFDVVALPFPATNEALVMRDLLESAHDALRVGGRLVAATDRSGRALGEAIEAVFGNATPGPPSKRGATFFAERRKAKSVHRDRSHVLTPEVVPADGGPAVRMQIETRPGTFSHGSVDRGTRALMEWYVPARETSILDLGAGCGAIGIHAALRCPAARVTLVESNVRAAECARRNLVRNGLEARVDVLVRADFEDLPPPSPVGTRGGGLAGAGVPGGSSVPAGPSSPGRGGWDVVLANPPYFGDFRIARSFAEAALRVLRPGGRAAFVAKRGLASTGHTEVVREVFGRCTPYDAGEYVVIAATKA